MEMTVPAGMYGTLMASDSGLTYGNLTPGASIAVNPADVPALTKLGFTATVAAETFPSQSAPPEFAE